MITKEINGKEYLFVEVPKEAIRPRVTYIQVDPDIIFTRPDGGVQYVRSVPMADYTTIGKASDLTEEQWRSLVHSPHPNFHKNESTRYFYDYTKHLPLKESNFLTAKESGLSLVQSIGMKPETTLILQKLT